MLSGVVGEERGVFRGVGVGVFIFVRFESTVNDAAAEPKVVVPIPILPHCSQ